MIKTTKDGSHTIYNQQFDETYHSENGALQEANHVYINSGFRFLNLENITIFELGFGTGLNAFLTLLEAEKQQIKVKYISVEKYPLSSTEIEKLNYCDFFSEENKKKFDKIHELEWGREVVLNEWFTIQKEKKDFLEFIFDEKIDLVYFDAFSYNSQPELWSEQIFSKIFQAMKPNSVLVTYSAKGVVKQNLRAAGFEIQRLKGAGGKWHMLRAIKS